MSISSGSLAPGVYIEAVNNLPNSLPCVSTTMAELMTFAARRAGPGAVGDLAKVPNPIVSRPLVGLAPTGGSTALRFFTAQGNQISGAAMARTAPAVQLNSVNILTAKIEGSIEDGLRWAVFENNNSVLWAKVVNSVEGFMQNLYQQGAFQGTSPSQAYFVQCGATTMTQNDLDNGRLIVIVGFAPLHPAEFVVLKVIVQTKKR